MRKFIFLAAIVSSLLNCSAQSSKRVVNQFITELGDKKVSNDKLISQYFILKTTSNSDAFTKEFLDNQLSLLRERTLSCKNLEVLKHDRNSKIVEAFNLETEGFNEELIFYLSCDGEILIPVLIQENRFLSISTSSKTENGLKKFVLY